MAKSLSPQRKREIKRLLKEGLYWEALNLPPGSSMGEIMLRLAELKQSFQGDQEALALLAEAKQDLQSGRRYPSDRELCDSFFKKLGNDFQQRIINEVIITREQIWREYIRQKPKPQAELAEFMLSLGTDLAEDLQKQLKAERIELDIAHEAADKSIHALEIAQIYAEDRKLVLALQTTLGCSLYCNLGVAQINQAQKKVNSVMGRVHRGVTNGREVSLRSLTNTFDTALSEIREGIKDIEKALQFDSQNEKVREQLKEGKGILDSIKRDREGIRELLNKKAVASYCNQGIERINRAQEELKGTVDSIFQENAPGDAEAQPERLREAFNRAIAEVKEGTADIERALQTDNQNPKVREQLKDAKRILEQITKERDGVRELLGKKAAASYCSRGIERINRAQEELRSAMDAIQSRISSGRLNVNSLGTERLGDAPRQLDPDVRERILLSPDGMEKLLWLLIPDISEARSRAISEVEAGIADIEEAERLDPHNQHIDDQRKIAQKVLENLKNMGGKVTRSSSSHGLRTSASVASFMASSKNWSVALQLAIFLGWLGVDRLYLGRDSAGLKLGLFLGCLFIMKHGFTWGVFALVALWWIVDIILIARCQLKDGNGHSLG